MTSLIGHRAAIAAFRSAADSGSLHHAWLLVGPPGVGKATFARAAALWLLAGSPPDFHIAADHPTRSLAEAGSHPDMRIIRRLPKDAEQPDQDLARSITIAQVRALQPMFATTPSLGSRRVVIFDAIDDLERGGANALLKNLEEPPAGTIFLLVSHAPGRLLPTIRSRCRLLRFEPLADDEVAQVVRREASDADDMPALVRTAEGAPGRALGFAGLDVTALDAALARIAATGDPDSAERLALGRVLGGKSAQRRYEVFLERAPALIGAMARARTGSALRTALDAHGAARDLAGAAIGLSLDQQATVFEMGGIVARLASRD